MKSAIVLFAHVVGLAVIRALGRVNVPVAAFHYSPNEMGSLSKYVTRRVRVPDPRKDENEFISKLIDLSHGFQGSLLIPGDDHTLVSLSKHKTLLEPYYVVGVAD